MSKWIYWISATIVLLAGLGSAVYFGVQPRSVPKFKLSQFESAQDIAKAIGTRLHLELKAGEIYMLGVWPGRPHHVNVAREIIDRLSADNGDNLVIIADSALRLEDLSRAMAMHVRDDLPAVAQVVGAARSQGKKVLILTASFFSSQLLRDNPAFRLRHEFGFDPTSFSMAPFPFTRAEEQSHEVQCLTNDNRTGTGPLGCAVLHKARSYYRKAKDPAKWNASLDLVGGRDYLLLVESPRTP